MLERISRRYSIALYEEAKSLGDLDTISGDVDSVVDIIESNRELALFFGSPIIDQVKKTAITKEIFEGKISKLMLNFILLLIERHRDGGVVDILKDFRELKNEKDGIVTVDVTSAVELTDDEKNQIKNKIDSYTKLNSKPTFKVEPDLVGGFIVKIKDVVLDASIRHQLEILRKRFKEGDIALN
jgi:F-type H+-transporting ATPase subunit delta